MTAEELKVKRDKFIASLSEPQRHSLAKAARVVSQDRGMAYQAALYRCIEHPEDVAAMAADFADLAKALRPEPSVEAPAPVETGTE